MECFNYKRGKNAKIHLKERRWSRSLQMDAVLLETGKKKITGRGSHRTPIWKTKDLQEVDYGLD